MNALVRIAWREFIGGFARFRIFLACLAIGAFAIAASGSVTKSFQSGATAQARTLLGGDVAFTAAQRVATAQELALLNTRGVVSTTAGYNAMGEKSGVRKQVDVRAVDERYPLIGSVGLSGGAASLRDALAFDGVRWGAAVSDSFLQTFGVTVGDAISVGGLELVVRARLVSEPDRLGKPGAFGPRALVHIDAARQAGRLDPGQLFRASYLVLLSDPADADRLERDAKSAWGPDGMRFRAPADAVDGLTDVLSLLDAFLAVVGVASLIAGGVGISQATSAFLESRVGSIAALKALGAGANQIRAIYAMQLAALAATGALIGVGLGALAPFALERIAGDRIPLPQTVALYPQPLLLAFALTMLTAIAFALPPLGAARATPPAALFRRIEPQDRWTTVRIETALALLAAASVIGVATAFSPRPMATAGLLAGAAGAYVILYGAAYLVRVLAKRMGQGARGAYRLMLSNLGGPGSLAPTVAPAVGLGLALLTLVASVQANLLRQISETAPRNAPSLVFSQIANADAASFDDLLARSGVAVSDPNVYRRVPTLLGRISALKGVPLAQAKIAPGERWAVEGETRFTYLADRPAEAVLVDGAWWPAEYSGPLLVSVEAGAAKGLGLRPGDTVGFRIFGRQVEATVANLRRVDWGGFGVNMPFILSPGTLEGANPQHFAIVKAPPEAEDAIVSAVGRAMPDVIVFQTREALATASRIFGEVAVAVNAAASVVTVAGLMVLAGALAAVARRRRTESALLKVFGATPNGVLSLYAGELAFVGAVSAILGVAMGVAASAPVVTFVFEAAWAPPLGPLLALAAGAIGVAAAGGALVGLALLSQKPAAVLRAP